MGLKPRTFTPVNIFPSTLVLRINFHGEEYHLGDYIVIGKQVYDLPIFARIVDIFVFVEYPLVEVKVYRTVGLSNHLMNY